jgi:hypothetical protein
MNRYLPFFVLIGMAALEAFAISGGWMRLFMGLLLCHFSMLKLFNLFQFADGFQMYDLIAKNFRPYALSYPFIELILGLAYLSDIFPTITNLLTIAVMSIGAVGVARALKTGLDVRCACMGTVLSVPLSTVTLTEDLGMGLMALFQIYSR